MTTLITGATGDLGRDLLPLIPGAHVLSRRQGRIGDLDTGTGLAAALDGVDTVIHLADGKDQGRAAQNLVSNAKDATHIVLISIAGIDYIPFGYYRGKLAAERAIVESGIPFTILRTTQFHQFALTAFTAQKLSPVLFAPKLRIQPIDTRVVAASLAELAAHEPAGRVADLGGPEVLTGLEIAKQLRWRRPVVPFSLPGATWSAFAAGYNLVPDNRAGGRTFAEFLAA